MFGVGGAATIPADKQFSVPLITADQRRNGLRDRFITAKKPAIGAVFRITCHAGAPRSFLRQCIIDSATLIQNRQNGQNGPVARVKPVC
jgi:hypothetical protein